MKLKQLTIFADQRGNSGLAQSLRELADQLEAEPPALAIDLMLTLDERPKRRRPAPHLRLVHSRRDDEPTEEQAEQARATARLLGDDDANDRVSRR
ncbi:MAG: hypothetical protein HOW73_00835 [Polyangiaceae bacterium]|nr:hypothetical protein [Polyangiaceae bacterium]